MIFSLDIPILYSNRIPLTASITPWQGPTSCSLASITYILSSMFFDCLTSSSSDISPIFAERYYESTSLLLEIDESIVSSAAR
jgi:hypothetical protein